MKPEPLIGKLPPALPTRDEIMEAMMTRVHVGIETNEWRPLAQYVLDLLEWDRARVYEAQTRTPL